MEELGKLTSGAIAMTTTMTMNAPAFEANLFFSLGYAAELASVLRLGQAQIRCYQSEIRLNSSLKHLLTLSKTFEFDPKDEHAREVVDILTELCGRIEATLAKRNESFSDPSWLQHWCRSIKRQNKALNTIVESWQLALNPTFKNLVTDSVNSLNLSGKSNSDWRTSLAELQD